MRFSLAKVKLPSIINSLLATISAALLTLSFPDFDLWFLAWFALVPLFFAVEREKESVVKSFVLGWIFGTLFFFGTCWWLTFAPTTYGGVPAIIAYPLLFGVALIAGLFPAIFSAIFSIILKQFGISAIFSAHFIWTATEFLRFSLTGNNWNSIGYSQAFHPVFIEYASVGGVYFVGFFVVLLNSAMTVSIIEIINNEKRHLLKIFLAFAVGISILLLPILSQTVILPSNYETAYVIAVQPNVPMSGLKYEQWINLRERHVALAENALQKINEQLTADNRPPTTVIFPESPMNFQFENDREFQEFIRGFAIRNKVSVLFNSAEPNSQAESFYNSAVMINERGEKIAQYDKIHLVPFGEYVPLPEPVAQFVPSMVGNYQYGNEYDLFPFGEAKGGVMICFESHFPSLSREFVRNGADVLIEMTNDGYLGETPILRQHLANAIFRAVESNRPVLRVTNVGVTAYINERGEVLDAAKVYTEGTRAWTINQSDGGQTFYVKYGDLFAWLCSLVSLALLSICFVKKKILSPIITD
jgi:apolipoprotein N-acyltransferase